MMRKSKNSKILTNIKTDMKAKGCDSANLIQKAQDGGRWRALVNRAKKAISFHKIYLRSKKTLRSQNNETRWEQCTYI
jgi:hypothetical protein